jgi:hypothetical protein
MWGGITNPIVPLGANLEVQPLHEAILRLHQPDVVVSFLPVGSTSGRQRHEQLRRRLNTMLGSGVPLLSASDDVANLGCHVLSVVDDEDLRTRQFFATRFITQTRREETVLLALFGRVYPGQEHDMKT